jgi:hypothetical protein
MQGGGWRRDAKFLVAEIIEENMLARTLLMGDQL